MRRLTIIRKKSFVGSVTPYFLFVGYRKTEVDPDDPEAEWDFPDSSDAKIANGQTVVIPIRDEECRVIVWANTLTGAASGPAYSIDAGTTDIELELVTQYSWIHGSKYLLRPLSAES